MGKRASAAVVLTAALAAGCGTTQTAATTPATAATTKPSNLVSADEFRKIISRLGYKDAKITNDSADNHHVATVAILGLNVTIDQVPGKRDVVVDHLGNRDDFTPAEIGLATLTNVRYELLAGALADPEIRKKFGGK